MTFDRPRAAVCIGGFCAFLDLYAPQAVLPQLAEHFHVTPATAGSTVGISTLAVAGSAPFVGMLADRLGRKVTIVAAALLLTLPTALLIPAEGLNEILLWRFVQGLLLPAIFSPLVALVSERWSPGDAADVLGLYTSGAALGGFSGRFVTALMADHFGWRVGFGTLTAMTLVCAVMLWAWLPDETRRAKAGAAAPPILESVLGHLRNPVLLVTYLVGFAILGSMVATFTYVNFRLADAPYHLSASQLGMIFLVYPIGAVAAPASGFLVRRLGRRMAGVLALTTSGIGLLATLHPSLSVIITGLAIFVIGIFTVQPVAMGFVGQAARSAKASAVGLYMCVYYIGGSAGAVLPGVLVWHQAGWTGCVLLVLMSLAACGVLAWWVWRDRPALVAAE